MYTPAQAHAPTQEGRLLEIMVQSAPGELAESAAQGWTQRLSLPDGVRVAVMPGTGHGRPRRFVVFEGRLTSPQRYAALSIADELEGLVRAANRPVTAWDLLQAARAQGSGAVGTGTMATITQAARLLARQGRLKPGPIRSAWIPVGAGEAAA